MKLSIIIVNYKVEEALFKCIKSIELKIKGVSYEIIVIENDKKTNLTRKLKIYKNVKYIRAEKNLGYGAGNNLGVKFASGEFLFILNPDTEIIEGDVKKILSEFNSKTGVVAPILLDKKGKEFLLQGTRRLTPFSAIFSTSIINKIFPNNPISKQYWMKGTNRNKKYPVDVVPGTAFIIKRSLFEKLKGFDEKFFLYFEEMDLSERIESLGYKLYMSPDLKIKHLWGESTDKEKNKDKIFKESRYYYFKKHFGLVKAVLLTYILEINLKSIILLFIIALGIFLRLDRLNLSIFIPDQGWFYLSARDLVLYGKIPLVGITTSHTWLHQGPLWTYMLAPVLLISNFNLFGGVYLAAFFGLLSIILIYKIGKDYLSVNFGLFAALLYATSPLVVIHERLAYHTAPISFFVLLFIYSVNAWVRGRVNFFPTAILSLALLYNLELAVVVFFPVLFLFLIYGYINKEVWFTKLLNKKIIFLSVLCLIIPMIPILIYDAQNGFPQTVKYAVWIVYSPLKSFFIGKPAAEYDFIWFNMLHLERLVIFANQFLSLVLFIISLAYIGVKSFGKIKSFEGIVFLSTLIPLIGYIVSQTPSEAYLPMLFGGILLSIAYLLYSIDLKTKHVGIALLILIALTNSYLVYNNNYLVEKKYGYGWSIQKKEEIVNKIYNLANGEMYNLDFRNEGHRNVVPAENYEYLLWWKTNNPPVNYPVRNRIQVIEGENDIKIQKIKL